MVDWEYTRGFVLFLKSSSQILVQRLLAFVVLVCGWEEGL